MIETFQNVFWGKCPLCGQLGFRIWEKVKFTCDYCNCGLHHDEPELQRLLDLKKEQKL